MTSRLESAAVMRSRRSFMKAVGTAALAYPFLRSLELSVVEAATGDMPQRLITFYHPHGTSSPLFRRRATDSENEFELAFTEPISGATSVLQPFDDVATFGTSFKQKLVVIDGLDFATDALGHDGTRSVFTGGGATHHGSSIEQYLAHEVGLGEATPFASLVLGVGTNVPADIRDNISYLRGVTVPKMIDPVQTFNTLFVSVLAQNDPEARAALEVARARGQSVVDYVRRDIQRLQTRLAPKEQAKLDQHLTSLRDIEKQLAVHESTCQAPDAPTPFGSVNSMQGGEQYFDAITNLQLDLMAQAMTCDLVRFGSFWMADLSRGAVLGTGIADDAVFTPDNPDIHETVAHAYRGPLDAGIDLPAEAGIPTSWAISGVQQRYCYGKAVRLMNKLEAAGLLDSSLLMIASDMGDTAVHSSFNVPYVLAGSASGKLRTGRYVSLKPECAPGARNCAERERVVVPNNRLLVSVARMFAQEVDSFGETVNPEQANGALDELV